MKKIYINPEMEVVLINTMTVLAASIDTVDNKNKVTPGTEESSTFFGSDNEDW
jgi:hypothetical protein